MVSSLGFSSQYHGKVLEQLKHEGGVIRLSADSISETSILIKWPCKLLNCFVKENNSGLTANIYLMINTVDVDCHYSQRQ